MPRTTRASKSASQASGSVTSDFASFSSKNTVAEIKDALNLLKVEVPSSIRLKNDLLELLLSSVNTSGTGSKKTKNSKASAEETVPEPAKSTRGQKKGTRATTSEATGSRRSRRDAQSEEEDVDIKEKPTRATRHAKAKPAAVSNNDTKRPSRRGQKSVARDVHEWRLGDNAEVGSPIAKDVKRWENDEDDEESDDEEEEEKEAPAPAPRKKSVAAESTATRSRASSRTAPVAAEKESVPSRRKRNHQSSDEESQDGNEPVRRSGRDRSISATAKPVAKKSKKSATPPLSPSLPRRNLRNRGSDATMSEASASPKKGRGRPPKLPKSGWVEEDVIREHLGENVEMGAPIAGDVRRWHHEDDNVELTGSRFGHYSKQDASPTSRRSSSRSKSPVKALKNTKSKKSVVVSSRSSRRTVGVTKEIKAPQPVRGTRNRDRSLTPQLASSSDDDDMDEDVSEEEIGSGSSPSSNRRASELLSSVNAALSGKKISNTEYKAALQLLNSAKEGGAPEGGEDDNSLDDSGDDELGSPSSLLASAKAAYEALASMEQRPEGTTQKRDRASIGGQWTSRESFLPPSPKQSRQAGSVILEASTVATNVHVNSGTATSRTALLEPPATVFKSGGRLSGSGASPYTQKGPFGGQQYYPQTEIRNMPSSRGDISHAALTTARKAQRISAKLDAAFSAPLAKQYPNKQSGAPTPGMSVGLGHMSMGLNRSGYLSNRSSFGSQLSTNSRLKMSPGSALGSYTPHFKENSVRFDPGDSLSGNKPLSLVQRRRKMRQSEGGAPQSGSKSAIMAKRILETLSDLQGPIEQSRKAPVAAPWETRRYSTNGIGVSNIHMTTKKVEPPTTDNGNAQQPFNIQGNANANGYSMVPVDTFRTTNRKEDIGDYSTNALDKGSHLSKESGGSTSLYSSKNTIGGAIAGIGGPFKSSAVAATMGTDSGRGSSTSSTMEKAFKKSKKTPIVQDAEYPFTEASDDNAGMDVSADSSRSFTFSKGSERSVARVKSVAELKVRGDKEVQKTISDAAAAAGDSSASVSVSKSSHMPTASTDTSSSTAGGTGIQANSAWAKALASNDISCPHCFQMQPPSQVKCDSCDNYLKCPHCDAANTDAAIDVCPTCNKKFVDTTAELPAWAAKKPAAVPAPAPASNGIKFGASAPAAVSTGGNKPFSFGSKPADTAAATEKTKDSGSVPTFGGSKSTAPSTGASSSAGAAPFRVPTFGAKSDKDTNSGSAPAAGGIKFGGFGKTNVEAGGTTAAKDASKPAFSFGSKTTDNTSTSATTNDATSSKAPFSFGSSSASNSSASNPFAKAGESAAPDKRDSTDSVPTANKAGGILSRLGEESDGGRGPPDDGPTKKRREASNDDGAAKPLMSGGFKFGGASASTVPPDNSDGGKKKPFAFGSSSGSDDAPAAAAPFKVPTFGAKSDGKDTAPTSGKAPFDFGSKGNKDKSDGAVAAAALTSLGDAPPVSKAAFSFGKKDSAGALGALDDAPPASASTTASKPFKFGEPSSGNGAAAAAPVAFTMPKFGANKDAPAATAPGPAPFKFGGSSGNSDDKKAGDALAGLASAAGTTFKIPTFGKTDDDKKGDTGGASAIFGAPSSNTISGSKSDAAPTASAPAPFKFSAGATGDSAALPAVNNMFGSTNNVAPLNSSNLEKISGKGGLSDNTSGPGVGPFGAGMQPPLPNTGSDSPGSAMDMGGYNSGDNSNLSAPSGAFGNTTGGAGAPPATSGAAPFAFGNQPTFQPPTFGSGTQAPMFGGTGGSQPFGANKPNTNLAGIAGASGTASTAPSATGGNPFGGGAGAPFQFNTNKSVPGPGGPPVGGGGGGFSVGTTAPPAVRKKFTVRRKKQ